MTISVVDGRTKPREWAMLGRAPLSADEETGLLDAFASLERGEGTDEDEMDARVASVLGL